MHKFGIHNTRRRVEIFIDGDWLPVLIEFHDNYFSMAWTYNQADYDLYPQPDYSKETSDAFWAVVRSTFPELMQGDGQDYFVNYPYSRLPAFKECK